MTATKKDPVFVVLQLSGGNDYFNTVIPYNDPLYRDNRPAVGLPEDQIIKLDDELGFNPAMQAMKRMYDQGNVAVINGVGYANSPRSHFRSMDIWHTCEPETVGTEGWLGRATRELDPGQENVITTVNIGQGLPRALVVRGVPVASVPDLPLTACSPAWRPSSSATLCSIPSPGSTPQPSDGDKSWST